MLRLNGGVGVEWRQLLNPIFNFSHDITKLKTCLQTVSHTHTHTYTHTERHKLLQAIYSVVRSTVCCLTITIYTTLSNIKTPVLYLNNIFTIHPMSWLRMSGFTPLLPPRDFKACRGSTLFYIYIHSDTSANE